MKIVRMLIFQISITALVFMCGCKSRDFNKSSVKDHSMGNTLDDNERGNLFQAVTNLMKARNVYCDMDNSIQMQGLESGWRQISFCYKDKAASDAALKYLNEGGLKLGMGAYGLPGVVALLDVTYDSKTRKQIIDFSIE